MAEICFFHNVLVQYGMTALVYLEWTRSLSHHLYLRVVFVLSALLYLYYFILVNQVMAEKGLHEISVLTPSEMENSTQILHPKNVNFKGM